MTEEREEGWGRPIASRKFHYFRQSRSLCRKWMFTGFDPDTADQVLSEKPQRDDCLACWRMRKAEQEPEKGS